MNELFVVIEGGCVRYVSSTTDDIQVTVIDLDDLHDAPDPDVEAQLRKAEGLLRLW